MENRPFDYVFPIQNGDIPASYVSLPEGTITTQTRAHILEDSITSILESPTLFPRIDKFPRFVGKAFWDVGRCWKFMGFPWFSNFQHDSSSGESC